MNGVRLAETELGKNLGREPTPKEIAFATGESVKHVVEIKGAGRAVTSLDKPVGDEQATFGELMASQEDSPPDEVQLGLDRQTLHEAVVELPEDERTVLELRYGLVPGAEPQTIAQVVRSLDCGRARVRRLEEDGLARLATRGEIQALR